MPGRPFSQNCPSGFSHFSLSIMPSLFAVVLLVFPLFACVANTRMVPFSRSNRRLVPSMITPSKASPRDSGLICGIGCGRNCRDEYQIGVRNRGEVRSTSRRFSHHFVSPERPRVVCDNRSMLSDIRRVPGKGIQLQCSRLSRHLRKTPVRGSRKILALSRMGIEQVTNESGLVVNGKGPIEQRNVRQAMNETHMCDESYYLDGLECVSEDCSELRLLCVLVEVDLDLAEQLLCDLLSPKRSSFRVGTYTSEGDARQLAGAGSPFGGLLFQFNTIFSYLLAGVHLLGDVEWDSSGPGVQDVSCPDDMFVSEVRYPQYSAEYVAAGHGSLSRHNVSIGCSRLESDLRIGPRTYKCSSEAEGVTSESYCGGKGFLTGLRFNDPSCAYPVVECRSLQCR